MSTSNIFHNAIDRVKGFSGEYKRKVLYRSKLIKLLTIDEAEKIYTSYVSKNLYQTKIDFRTKKEKKVRLSFARLKLAIRFHVDTEQILYIVPRLKEVQQ